MSAWKDLTLTEREQRHSEYIVEMYRVRDEIENSLRNFTRIIDREVDRKDRKQLPDFEAVEKGISDIYTALSYGHAELLDYTPEFDLERHNGTLSSCPADLHIEHHTPEFRDAITTREPFK